MDVPWPLSISLYHPSLPRFHCEELRHLSREIKNKTSHHTSRQTTEKEGRMCNSFSTDFENTFHHCSKRPLRQDSFSLPLGQGDLINKGGEGPAHSLSSMIQVHVYWRLRVWNQEQQSPSEKTPVGSQADLNKAQGQGRNRIHLALVPDDNALSLS